MRQKQFTLTAVEPKQPDELWLRFADGECFTVRLTQLVKRYSSLARLQDAAVFCTAAIGEFGASVIWANDDDLELAADNLRARAIEQAGGVSHEFIWSWMARNDLTLDEAAAALGISRRMLAYYRSGAKPVPRTIALACRGWEDVQREGPSALAA